MIEWGDHLQRSLTDLLRWWLTELTQLVPESLRRRIVAQRTRLVLLVDSPGDNLVEETGQNVRNLGRIELSATQPVAPRTVFAGIPRAKRNSATNVVLRFPGSRALRTPASLPLAAEKNLSEVIGFEFERLVPFSRSDVYYAYRLITRDKQAQMLRVELTVLPRAEVAKLGQAIEGLGLRVAGLEIMDSSLEPALTSIPLDDRSQGSPGKADHSIVMALGVVSALLAMICVTVPFWRAAAAVQALRVQMEELRGQAEAGVAIEKQIEAKRQEQQFLADRKRATLTVTELLATLTALIPDDAYLTELSITGDHLRLVGAANSATALLTLIDQAPEFRGVAFQSPIIQDPRLNRERFDITARIAQRGSQ